MNKRDLFILITVIVMVFVLFIVYATISIFTIEQPTPSATPAPLRSSQPIRPLEISPRPSSAISLPPVINGLSKETLINLLPLQTDSFDVEYLSVSDHFVITIKKDPYAANKTAAETWIKELGFEPGSLNIYWQAFPELKR